MPELCRFYGIIIRMYSREHAPPHFHAVYGGDEALVDIDNPTIVRGRLPPRATAMVLEWASLHHDELLEAWGRAINMEPPGKIEPLE